MIDLNYARAQFEAYLNNYDRTDDKIHLKEVHTFCVVDAADAICRGEGLSEEDHQLALLIALLHDIGRFEQLKAFHSFQDSLFDHAKFGVKVLFEDGMIRQFIKDSQYDSIIKKAIAYHSLYSLDEAYSLAGTGPQTEAGPLTEVGSQTEAGPLIEAGSQTGTGPQTGSVSLTEREALHCKLIRDADKLDNFRVKDMEAIETLFDVSEETVAREPITPVVMDTVRRRESVFSPDRITHMDCWVSYLAFIFDLNFPSSFRWILERDYFNRNIDRIAYENPQTKADMEELRRIGGQYIKERAFEGKRTLSVALLQLAPGESLEENQKKGIEACRRAKAMGADIALFPEMWSNGYRLYGRPAEEWKAEAIPAAGDFVQSFGTLAKELDMAVGITFLEKWEGGPRNSLALFDRHGKLSFTYAKVHTCDFDVERNLTQGEDFFVTELDTASGPVQVGAMICYDREFPESARILMLKGAEIVLVPNACPMEINRLSQLRGRAYENMMGIATCNYPEGVPDCNGGSSVFDGVAYLPELEGSRDTCILQAGGTEGIYVAELNLEQLRRYRETEALGNAYRHPKKYGLLTETDIRPPFVRGDYRE